MRYDHEQIGRRLTSQPLGRMGPALEIPDNLAEVANPIWGQGQGRTDHKKQRSAARRSLLPVDAMPMAPINFLSSVPCKCVFSSSNGNSLRLGWFCYTPTSDICVSGKIEHLLRA